MEFCEKCGGMIILQDNKAVCAGCGHKAKKMPKVEASEKIKAKESVAVIKEGSDNILPVIEIECPKCSNKKAYFWTTQTRSADESETKFYRCTKCNHAWRKYR